MKKHKGYTLLELIVVVSIILILISISVNTFASMAGLKEKMEIKRVHRDILSTRTLAKRESKYVNITFSERGYSIYTEDKSVASKELKEIKFSTGESNRVTISFTNRGIPAFDGAGTLYFLGRNKKYKITVVPVSGSVNLGEAD